MSSGERPIGAAKGKQSDTEALCQTPPPEPLARGPLGGGGGGAWEREFWEGRIWGGGSGRVGSGAGVQVGRFGGVHAPKAKRWSIRGSPYLPLPSL